MTLEYINQELQTLKEKKNYRSLPTANPRGARCSAERTTNVEPIF